MGQIAIGIDLGTSNSCVACVRDGEVEVLANACGEHTTASVVAVAADGTITVGNSAKANIIHDPHNTIHSSKRLIGRYYFSEEVKKARAVCSYEIVQGPNNSLRIKIRNELFSLPEVAAMVLREMKSIAETRLGQKVSQAVITVPAYFNDNQRQATRDAGRIAGLEVLRIVNEPTAAALAYGFGKGESQRVAVYDLGGGTFDISVLEFGGDVFEVLATCGDTFLGGDDFDDRVIDLLAEKFQAEEGLNLRNDPFALEKLKLAAEDAKKGLSADLEVDIRIPDVITRNDGSTASIEHRLDARDFSTLVQDLVQRTFKVCDEALQQAGLVASDLDGVILVGGPTRLPVIRDAVTEYFQQEPNSDVDPDRVVAMGAAIHADSLSKASGEDSAYLLDVTPLSLRIGVAGGLAETVIEPNTPVPIEQSRSFTTFKDYQESVNIRVYQGESREARDNEMLGQFEFSGFKRAARGEVEIEVTFSIDADGIVSVTAADRETGQRASTRITLSSGLTSGEVENIIQTGRTDRVRTTADVVQPAEADEDLELVALDAESVVSAEPVVAPQPVPTPEPAPAPAPEPAVAPPPAPAAAPEPVAAPQPEPPSRPAAALAEPASDGARTEIVLTDEDDGPPLELAGEAGSDDAPTDEHDAYLDGLVDEGAPEDRESLFDSPGTDLRHGEGEE